MVQLRRQVENGIRVAAINSLALGGGAWYLEDLKRQQIKAGSRLSGVLSRWSLVECPADLGQRGKT